VRSYKVSDLLPIEGNVIEESFENLLVSMGLSTVCGVDEAGRGPLAGPVVAAAVLYSDCGAIRDSRDSKVLSIKERERLYDHLIRETEFAIGTATHHEIESVNILQASLMAMARAVGGLHDSPDVVLVDGIHVPILSDAIRVCAIRKGDKRIRVIGAASIIAKVTRDRIMREYDQEFPGYGFARHFGYPTSEHLSALRRLGPCPIHRKTFKGVREYF